MATSSEGGGKDEIKIKFVTREGTYKLMPLSEYSRPNRTAYNGQTNTAVRVSFSTLNDPSYGSSTDKICFNHGKELYVYIYKGIRKAADLTKPVDKRVYKGTYPTCHDFNGFTACADSVMLLVGFTAGQVQLIDPIKKELSKLYNEERLIDKSKVTCIKWIPGSPNQFLVSHSSGQMYVYNEELPCGQTAPHYQLFKQGDSFSVHTCKTKSTRNPLYRWVIGDGGINQFTFSPCSKYLAVVSHDGYLRVFDYNAMDLVGTMRSYFGGLLCVSWSPDSKYIVVGGEDDLVSVWSFVERRVVCRGQGHKSWVNTVAFDPYTCTLGDTGDGCDLNSIDIAGSDEEEFHSPGAMNNHGQEAFRTSTRSTSNTSAVRSRHTSSDSHGLNMTCYRFGSIAQDTTLCLWDLTEDVLRQPMGRHRTSTALSHNTFGPVAKCNNFANSTSNSITQQTHLPDSGLHHNATGHHATGTVSTSLTQKFATLALGDRKEKDKDHDKKDHKRNFSLASRSSEKSLLKANHVKPLDDAVRLLGTTACPKLHECPLLEPLVCEKVAHERLTALVFREDCVVTACQEGCVWTWARPGKVTLSQQHTVASPQQSTGSTAL